ncbi:hypothetical protein DFQ28_008312 [Apophysomyces sp. BC1034]|nr:hypothetical protein DFQ30_007171 [Apophysomyces sp. BC1015]KAG0181922.1 hypothetical protein DFQ29_006588 [Apophysomyces sp. BC1021]KAG0192689.1 hypothetical protein DFQ28_008312 [Apophysomyces sp. BC1034]
MAEPTNAGIIEVGEERWIPASRRADGSIRKERRVRPGFVPMEDVQRYSNARTQPKPVASQYPPGYVPKKKAEVPGSKPKAKKQEPNKKELVKQDQPSNSENTPKKEEKGEASKPEQPSASEKSPEEKKIKALQKKLRQIAELEQKLIKGEELNAEQHSKVKKGTSLREELAKLSLS